MYKFLRRFYMFVVTVCHVFGISSSSDSLLLHKCHEDFYSSPQCLDQPEGYYCECGPGFLWNSHSCVAEAVDSRMVFASQKETAYAIIDHRIKIIPRLAAFSIATFLKLSDLAKNGTLFSYKTHNGKQNFVRAWYRSHVGLQLELTIESKHGLSAEDERVVISLKNNIKANEWYHLAWIVGSHGSIVYWNGESISKRSFLEPAYLPERGELVLGQSSENHQGKFDLSMAFVGEISHFNVWNGTLSEQDVGQVFADCIIRYCGTVVEWSDLRYGTRGSLVLKWPTGIIYYIGLKNLTKSNCLKVDILQSSCDHECSLALGAQCKAGIRTNIQWQRTPANRSTSEPCPGLQKEINSTHFIPLAYAHRSCYSNANHQGKWMDADYSSCVSPTHWRMLENARALDACNGTYRDYDRLLNSIINITSHQIYTNPMDLHVMIEIVQIFSMPWNFTFCNITANDFMKFLPFNELKSFAIRIISVADELTRYENMPAWNMTRPPGQEGWNLLLALHVVYSGLVNYLRRLMTTHDLQPSDVSFIIGKDNIVAKVSAFNLREFMGDALPDLNDLKRLPKDISELGTIAIQKSAFDSNTNASSDPTPTKGFSVTAIYKFGDLILPHVHLKGDWKKSLGDINRIENNLNSAVFHIVLFEDSTEVMEIRPIPVKAQLTFKNDFNISDIKCVKMTFHDKKDTHWSPRKCQVIKADRKSVNCQCMGTGLMAVTTDMYDEDWDKGEKPIRLLQFPSYIGCAVSSLLCLTTCFLLTYFRTASNTAMIHRHFSLAVVGGQLVFVFGIDKMWNELLCQSMAVLIHYFFLASFAWLMNEAFNLYIVITYAAHSHEEANETGGMWRYYLIGWIMPAVLVGTFVGINGQSYYAKTMCWSSPENVWLYAGPAISLVAITVLVLTFTAKEQNESSYTKDEKSNKAIAIHSKALWTQVILLSLSWSFAFVSVVMQGIIVKLLFSMFDCLQGIFFIVFYFLLNDEVQYKHAQNQKLRALALHDLHDDDDDEDADDAAANVNLISDGEESQFLERSSKVSHRPRSSLTEPRRRRVESSNGDDASDCEMMVTSV